MLVFVTGVAGSGKSTLCAELAGRGLEAHDADLGVARHVRAATGEPVASPPRERQTPEWAARHEYRFDLGQVEELARKASRANPAFLLGAAYGDDEVAALAQVSFFLDLDAEELRRRLAARPPGSYGHAPHEIDSILAWHAAAAGRYAALGARRLDAALPVGALADELVAAAASGDSHRPPRLP